MTRTTPTTQEQDPRARARQRSGLARFAKAAALTLTLAAPLQAAAGAQPPSGAGIIGAACPGEGAARLILLPEELAALDEPTQGARFLTVTGTYTATDKRDQDRPKPVGLFLHRGQTVSLEYGRMDGILVIQADGAAAIFAAPSVQLGETVHDLTGLGGRRAFAQAAAEAGASALQSHLLIRDGVLDLRPVEDAPRAERRILFQTETGALALWQSGGRALTLHEAAEELSRLHHPAMAMNLDMGSYDFCERLGPDGPRGCGFLGRDGTKRLSNLLRLRLAADCG